MKRKTSIKAVLLAITTLYVLASEANVIHQGEVVVLTSHSSALDSSNNESWSSLQLTGLSSVAGCSSGDEGFGNLTYIALPDSERYAKSLLASAYLKSRSIKVLLDNSNLYEGMCRIKHVYVMPAVAQ